MAPSTRQAPPRTIIDRGTGSALISLMPGINRERWLELEPWLDQALELPAEARAQWLDELYISAPGIAADVGALLARETAADRAGFLAQPQEAGPVGMEVGAWTVVRSLGQGGMASVWLAHRTDGHFEGQAAVKFLNLALIGSIGVERFKREGSMLARLTHPGIARLLDAGVQGGQPYLVLEYVDGQRIDEYVRGKQLGRHAIVQLFLQVLAAVEHAHANLIVHRDLKPSNILVTSDGTVKLLDFGIAKLLEDGGPASPAVVTLDGATFFTPAFAAPEQLQGSAITTVTDVFTLGVLLHLLLSGRHPSIEPSATPVDAMRAVLEHEPGPLGMGDLDSIVGMALRKVPGERYPGVAAFADDLQRYLHQEPVNARPHSVSYRTGKFLRRHRAGVTVAVIAIAGLLAATAFSVAQMREARRQRDVAVQQRQRADAQLEFESLLMSQVGDAPITIREILDRARGVIEKQYAGNATMLPAMVQLAQGYSDLGDLKVQGMILRDAERLATTAHQPVQLAEVRCQMADNLRDQGKYAEAMAALDGADSVLRTAPDPGTQAACLMRRSVLLGESDANSDAVGVARQALAIKEGLGETNDQTYQEMLLGLADAQLRRGEERQALATYHSILAKLDSTGRSGTMGGNMALHNASLVLIELGEPAQAEGWLHKVLVQAAAADGWEFIHFQPLIHYSETALAMGHADSAARYFDKVVTQARQTTNRYWEVRGLFGLARAQVQLGRPADTRRSITEFKAAKARIPNMNATDDEVPDANTLEGWLAFSSGNAAGAHRYFMTALQSNGYFEGKRTKRLRPVAIMAAETALLMGNLDSALALAKGAHDLAALDSLTEVRSSRVGEANLIIGRVMLAGGDTTGARRMLQQALTALTIGSGPDFARTLEARMLLQELGADSPN